MITAVVLLADLVGMLSVLSTTYLVASIAVPESAVHVYDGIAIVLPVLLAAYAFAGLYGKAFIHPALEMQHASAVTGVIGGTAALTIYVATGIPEAAALLAVGGMVGAVVMPVCRGLVRILCARLPWWGVPTVVLSAGPAGQTVIDTLRRWPEIGLRPVAVLADDASGAVEGVPVLGGPDRAPHLARAGVAPFAILAMPDLPHGERAKLLARVSKFFDHVFVVGPASGSPAMWTTGRSGEGLCGFGVRHYTLQPLARIAKRTVDLLLGSLATLLFAPLLTAIAALIKFDSPGPVLFRQHRMGREGRVFVVWKFRTMHVNAPQMLKEILANDPAKRREYEQFHKLQDDPRVTRIGRILRRYSLDELPQIFNVLRGDMSLVGPRAYMPGELPKMKGLAPAVLQTPPGITGLWQVSGRNHLSFDDRVDLDVHYIQNWSPWLDLYVLVRTIPVVLSGDGAS